MPPVEPGTNSMWGSANARSQRKTRRKSSEKIPKGADAAKTYFAALRRVRQAVFDFSDPVLQAGICERIFRAENTRRAPCFCAFGSMVKSINFI